MRFPQFLFLCFFLSAVPAQETTSLTVYGAGTGFFPLPMPLPSHEFLEAFSVPDSWDAQTKDADLLLLSQTTETSFDALEKESITSGWGMRAGARGQGTDAAFLAESRWFRVQAAYAPEHPFVIDTLFQGIFHSDWGFVHGLAGIGFRDSVSERLFAETVIGMSIEGHRFVLGANYRDPLLWLPVAGWSWNKDIWAIFLFYGFREMEEPALHFDTRLGHDLSVSLRGLVFLQDEINGSATIAGSKVWNDVLKTELAFTWDEWLKSSVKKVVFHVELLEPLGVGGEGGVVLEGGFSYPTANVFLVLSWLELAAGWIGGENASLILEGVVAW